MITHHDDHLANVLTVKGMQPPPASARLIGIEIETGWQTEPKRTAFLRDLEKAGVGDMCISKHDGTIGNEGGRGGGTKAVLPAELVTIPLTPEQARKFMDAVGRVTESRVDKGLITSGCGVHVHVSQGMFDANNLWRYAAGICQDVDHIAAWLNRAQITKESKVLSDAVHKYWDAICLRGATAHSSRAPFRTAREIPDCKDHHRAFIHGRSTPTYETRIFRMPKSRQVLTSYLDSVLSLHEFASRASEFGFAEEVGKQPDPAVIERLRGEALGTLGLSQARGTMVYYDRETGEQFEQSEIEVTDSGYYPAPDLRPAGKRILTTDEWTMVNSLSKGIGALGWLSGTMPLKEYIAFVIEQGDRYPALARRLSFDKFAGFRSGKGPAAATFDHRTKTHAEFQQGCLVRLENGKGETYVLNGSRGDNGNGVEQWMLHPESDIGGRFNASINTFIHICSGATDVGGEV